MSVHEFVDGISYMLKDVTYFHPLIGEELYKSYYQLLYKQTDRPAKLLTKREWEVLGELVKGYQNEEIARNLDISDKTVKNHITSILGKLGVKDRTKAVLMALRKRWFYLCGEKAAQLLSRRLCSVCFVMKIIGEVFHL